MWAPSKELPPTTDLQRAPLLERIEGVPTGRPATQVEDDGLHGQATVGRDLFRRDGDYWSVVFDEPDPRPSVLEPV